MEPKRGQDFKVFSLEYFKIWPKLGLGPSVLESGSSRLWTFASFYGI
jgi:hypothetical protein